MYKHFFGLRESPFNVNPDPRFLFLTPQTQEALDELTYGIQTRKGLVLLTGEVGTGKTTLLNRLLDWLREQQTPTAFIFNSHLEISHLFDFIMADFGVPFDARLKDNALMRLNQWLFERYRADETPVIIVDEAQGLPDQVLEEIRMLLNLETPGGKLLQIVLAGQPELEARLKRPELRQVKQRITLRCKTAALTLDQTHDYIQARLHIAGANGKPVFAPQAMDAVHFYSRGVPRVINLLCEHALINAYVDHVRPVPEPIVAEVAREFQFDDFKPVPRSLNTTEALNSNLIFAPPTYGSRQEALPITADSRKEHLDVLSNRASASSAARYIALSPPKELARSDSGFEGIRDHSGDAETSSVLGVPITLSGAPGSKQSEASPASELTQFFSEIVNQFTPRMLDRSAPSPLPLLFHAVEAKETFELSRISGSSRVSSPEKPLFPPSKVEPADSGYLRQFRLKIIALRSFLARWSAICKNRSLSSVISPTRIQRTVGFPLTLRQLLRQVRVWYRHCLDWRDRCLVIAGSIDGRRMKASIYGWLREPWSPSQWNLPDLRVFEALRRLSYKKM
jgi:general secretion pathway protein A